MAWFKKDKKPKAVRESRERSTVPEGLWLRCDGWGCNRFWSVAARSLAEAL